MAPKKGSRTTDQLTEAFASPDNIEAFENPTKRAIKFSDLPEDLQRLLFYLDPDDVRLLRKAINILAFLEKLGGLIKWAILAFCTATTGVVLLGDQFGKIAEWRVWALFNAIPKK